MSVPILQSSLRFRIRFSEIDAMRVVWHGAYAKYFEDAREQFGKDFGLDYLMIERNGFYAPIVDLSFQYKQPLRYGMEPEIVITYRPTEAAKIVFDYEIRAVPKDGSAPLVKYFFSPAYAKMAKFEPERQRFWFDVAELPQDREYVIEVRARNCYGKTSRPLVSGVWRSEPGLGKPRR